MFELINIEPKRRVKTNKEQKKLSAYLGSFVRLPVRGEVIRVTEMKLGWVTL